jgi:hypothetical protein
MKPGRELDALIAEKVMGATRLPGYNVLTVCNTGRIRDHWPVPDWDTGECIPFYSTNILAAWEVVEKIKSLTEYNGKLHATREPWLVFCTNLSDIDDGFNLNFWDVNPLTICLAAIETIGVSNPS